MVSLYFCIQISFFQSCFVESDGLLRSYCQWETFNATCDGDDVIIVTSASYGRMRIGRCLTVDYSIGCMADVTHELDGRCSGRQTCTIRIPDAELFTLQPCRRDLIAYMDASYKCVTRKYVGVSAGGIVRSQTKNSGRGLKGTI